MLLSPWFISNHNPGLTAEALHFVLKNVLSLGEDVLNTFKERANIPLMRLESTYDDLPLEVQGLFVMEPYFPRKHFNRAFAWLFGKESIEQIDAESFAHHERLKLKNYCYSLGRKLDDLQFTKEEYKHIYGEFRKLFDIKKDAYFCNCKDALIRHKHLSLEDFLENRKSSRISSLDLYNANADVSGLIFNELLSSFERNWSGLAREDRVRKLIDEMELPLSFEYLSEDRRRKIQAMIEPKYLTLKRLRTIYNYDIPDDVFETALGKGVINKRGINQHPEMLSDERLPKEMAAAMVFSTPAAPAKYAVHYFSRKDINEAEREKVLLALLDAQINDQLEDGVPAKKAMANLISKGLLTLPEIELVHDKHQDPYDMRDIIFQWMNNSGIELPPAIQEKWTAHEFCSSAQLLHYHDIPALVEVMRAHYLEKDKSPDQKALQVTSPDLVLFNPRWTRESLLALLDIIRQEPHNPKLQVQMEKIRKEVINKLFCESIYPSLDKEDLTGRYGRAENLLARVLDGDAHRLGEFDINLIINSRLQLDYQDAEVNLANSLARHPELNERIIAERLQLRMDLMSDTPALAPARQRRAI
ncbi:TPA: hypothetical protein RQN23_003003 [Aeromonas veronii]|nr:hypothetical protein [Aeromonas veronii]